MPLFVRLTLLIAAVLLAIVVLGFLLKLAVIAAVLAALGVAGYAVVRGVQRRLDRRRGAITASGRR